jgi:hypothetical protein
VSNANANSGNNVVSTLASVIPSALARLFHVEHRAARDRHRTSFRALIWPLTSGNADRIGHGTPPGGLMGPAMLGALVALALGLAVGSSSQRARRARSDYRKTRSLVLGLRKTAWSESIRGLRITAVCAAIALALFVVMNRLGRL